MLGGQKSLSFPCASMIYTMPRSLPLHNQWRILFAALVTLCLLLCTAGQVSAQKGKARKPAPKPQTTGNGNTATTQATPQQPAKKNLAAVRTGESPEGGRATITSDAPLNDYEAYRSGNRYYVVIPQANAPSAPGNARGRGFDDVQVHKRGNDTVLSFRLKPGTTAHVNQKFNRLEVVFNSPSDSASGQPSGTANTSNTNAGTSNPVTGAGNTNQRPGSATAAGTTAQPNANTGPNATAGPTVVPGANTALTNNGLTAPPVAATSPGPAGDAALPPVTPGLGPTAENPATAAASPTPPADQVAQAQTAPSAPTSAVTTTPATSGSSLGAVLKTNWLPILIAALVLAGIGLLVMTRSRARRDAPESERSISGKESAAALAKATPEKADSVAPGAAATVAGGAVAVVAATAVEREAKAEPVIAATAMDETETVEAEAPGAFDIERVRLEIKHVLTGEPYDETIINTPVREARQLIESELLFALSKRHTERRHRALKAFTEHGYFDDVTRELRTAAVTVERAQAARKLGLTRDTACTPHLIAALEDPAPEVRRAAVEALTEVQDAEAVAPLEALLKREADRKVPAALIQRAIRASSVRPTEAEEKAAAEPTRSAPVAEAATEQAVIEEAAATEALPVSVEESASPVAESAALEPGAASVVAESLASAPDALARTDDETPTLETKPEAHAEQMGVAPVEATSELAAGALALAPAIVEGIATAQADAAERRRVETEAARIHSEQEAQRKTAEEERLRVEAEARRAEEQERLRVEEARRAEEEAQRRRVEEEQRRVEEEQRRAEEERLRLEAEQRRVEEEHRQAEERQRLEAERLRLEEEQRAEEERLRAEAEAERQREEAAVASLRVERERRQAEEERERAAEQERRRAAEEKERQEEEARLRLATEESERLEEARRQRSEERERRRAEEERERIEAEGRDRNEADAARRRAEDAAMRLAEMRRRMEEESRQREAAEAERLRLEEEERQRAEEEAAASLHAEEEAAAQQQEEERRAEEERLRVEAEAQRTEEERQREESEAAARRMAMVERQRAEEQERRHAEEERMRVEAEARQREEAEAARVQFEREATARRLREEAEATIVEAEVSEPVYTEAARPTAQSDLFEATFTEPEPFAPASEAPTETTAIEAAPDWIDVDITGTEAVPDEPPAVSAAPFVSEEAVVMEEAVAAEDEAVPVRVIEEYPADTAAKEVEPSVAERGLAPSDEDFSSVPGGILRRLGSESADERAVAVTDLARVGGDDAFREISAAFDDPSSRVRDAAARALFDLHDDHAASFTRALREAPPERRRKIGSALATSGLASQAISHLMGESREKTYDAFSLLFLMSKAGEVQPLMRAIEEHPNSEVRLAVVKLLALSGQQDILPAFRRLAVRGSLPTEVRSAVMEAIYQISSQSPTDTSPVA
jgi:hypothetical protein